MPAAHASQLPVGDEEKFPAGQGVHNHEVPALEYSPFKHGSQVASLPPSEVWPGAEFYRLAPCASVETRPGVFATPTRCIRAATDASAMNPARV